MIKDSAIKAWFQEQRANERASIASVFGVDYAHLILSNEDDFFITHDGLSLLGNLVPTEFRAHNPWFEDNSVRLQGTGCVYRVRTKGVEGCRSDVVVKWNRMGEEVPGRREYDQLQGAEFNSPFEEFGLVKELRDVLSQSEAGMPTQKPLGIYVPSEKYAAWQTGRSASRMKSILDAHTEIELDMNRMYMLVFEWLEGVDVAQAFRIGQIDGDSVRALTQEAAERLAHVGFLVRDNKPDHIILRPDGDGAFQRDEEGRLTYGIVDYELLERTKEREEGRRQSQRKDYHRRQRDRFVIAAPRIFLPHLHHVNILGVDYIFGKVESTKGRLWVIGKDPYLFDYFLPERWEGTIRTKISMFSESYSTVTKDEIQVVWEVSKVGLVPDVDPFLDGERLILDHGYNSPFEEVSLAVSLAERGVATIYPRAIYMAGSESRIVDRLSDKTRYESHRGLLDPEGRPVLVDDHNYIIIWGQWNGPDEKLAVEGKAACKGINTLYAYRDGIISEEEYLSIVQSMRERLRRVGVEDLNLGGKHLLISVDGDFRVIRDDQGKPDIRICNFEFLKWTGEGPARPRPREGQ